MVLHSGEDFLDVAWGCVRWICSWKDEGGKGGMRPIPMARPTGEWKPTEAVKAMSRLYSNPSHSSYVKRPHQCEKPSPTVS